MLEKEAPTRWLQLELGLETRSPRARSKRQEAGAKEVGAESYKWTPRDTTSLPPT